MLKFCGTQFANLIFLPVSINGKEFTALFDTGAQMSFITESVTQQLGLKKNEDARKAGNNQGKTLDFYTCMCESIRIDTFEFTNQKLGVFPDEFFDFGVDENQNSFPAQMFFGWDLISKLCWEFDMPEKTVCIQPGGTLCEGEKMEWNTFPIFPIFYKDANVIAGFDCGHTETLLDRSWLEKVDQTTAKSAIIQGMGSKRVEDVRNLDEFTIHIAKSMITLSDIEIVDHEIYGTPEGEISILLGADILKNTVWKLDYKSRYFDIISGGMKHV